MPGRFNLPIPGNPLNRTSGTLHAGIRPATPLAGLFVATLLFASAAWGQTVTAGLEVTATNYNAATRDVTVQLHNKSAKTVTAFTLLVKSFDAAGKQISIFQIGFELLCYRPTDPCASDQIKSGETKLRGGIGLRPGTLSTEVSVAGVAYDDRTAEGSVDAVGALFGGRAQIAQSVRQSIALLTPTPTTLEEIQAAVKRMRATDLAIGLGALANNTNRTSTFMSDKSANFVAMPARADLDKTMADLQAQAAFWDLQSKEIRP